MFSSMIPYIVGQEEINRKEMAWERNGLFVGQDFSSAFIEKQKNVIETEALSD